MVGALTKKKHFRKIALRLELSARPSQTASPALSHRESAWGFFCAQKSMHTIDHYVLKENCLSNRTKPVAGLHQIAASIVQEQKKAELKGARLPRENAAPTLLHKRGSPPEQGSSLSAANTQHLPLIRRALVRGDNKRKIPVALEGGLVKAPPGPAHRDTGVIAIQKGSYVFPPETVRALGGAKVLDDFVERTTGQRPPVHQALPAADGLLGLVPGFDDGGEFGDIGADGDNLFASDATDLVDTGTGDMGGDTGIGAGDLSTTGPAIPADDQTEWLAPAFIAVGPMGGMPDANAFALSDISSTDIGSPFGLGNDSQAYLANTPPGLVEAELSSPTAEALPNISLPPDIPQSVTVGGGPTPFAWTGDNLYPDGYPPASDTNPSLLGSDPSWSGEFPTASPPLDIPEPLNTGYQPTPFAWTGDNLYPDGYPPASDTNPSLPGADPSWSGEFPTSSPPLDIPEPLNTGYQPTPFAWTGDNLYPDGYPPASDTNPSLAQSPNGSLAQDGVPTEQGTIATGGGASVMTKNQPLMTANRPLQPINTSKALADIVSGNGDGSVVKEEGKPLMLAENTADPFGINKTMNDASLGGAGANVGGESSSSVGNIGKTVAGYVASPVLAWSLGPEFGAAAAMANYINDHPEMNSAVAAAIGFAQNAFVNYAASAAQRLFNKR